MANKLSDAAQTFHGDCGQILETLKPNSFQAIIADPPYFQACLISRKLSLANFPAYSPQEIYFRCR